MQINSVNTTFQGVSRLAQKAEKRLQRRLVNPDSLMLDLDGIYRRFSTGKKFTGKYRIATENLEQFFHIKNGELYFTLVKGLDGSRKVGGFGIGKMRLWVGNPSAEEKAMIARLSDVKDMTDAGMMQNFGTMQCIENGTSTFIGSRGW